MGSSWRRRWRWCCSLLAAALVVTCWTAAAYGAGAQAERLRGEPGSWRACQGQVNGQPLGQPGQQVVCGSWPDRPEDLLVRRARR